jgi:hypothetical protein
MQTGNITADGKTNEMYHASKVVDLVIQKLKKYPNIIVQEPKDGASISEVTAMFKSFKPDCAIDCHTNAGGGHGCTVLCTSVSRNFANCIYKYLSEATPDNDRRVVDGSGFAFCNNGGIIAEMLFHDCPQELEWYKHNYETLAIAIEKGICEYLGVEYVEENNTNKIKYNNTILGNETDIQNLYEVIFEIIGYKVKVYSQNTDELTNTCIAIGGTGATNGITDINLNGATRIFGTDREETKQRIKEFLVDKLIDNKLIEENKQLNIKVTELENKIKNAITELQ